jgi:7,8-dihydroneopterin aldolase/epimerase/oxygenase
MVQTLELENMRFYAFHGVMPNEQLVGGEYSVSFKIMYDFDKAQESDDMNDAIDYGNIYEIVRKELMQPSKLIERVARRVQDAVLSAYPQIEKMETKVSKHRPPIEGILDCASIILQYSKE